MPELLVLFFPLSSVNYMFDSFSSLSLLHCNITGTSTYTSITGDHHRHLHLARRPPPPFQAHRHIFFIPLDTKFATKTQKRI
jgi:hypothetical protein